MEKVTEFKPLFSGNETGEGQEAKNTSLSKWCLGMLWTPALQVPNRPSRAPGPSQPLLQPSREHERPAAGKQSCPFRMPSSATRHVLCALRVLCLQVVHLRTPAVDSKGTVCFV